MKKRMSYRIILLIMVSVFTANIIGETHFDDYSETPEFELIYDNVWG